MGAGTDDAVSAFEDIVAGFDYPMLIVTTRAADDGERAGCLIGFAAQCSIGPSRFFVWISKRNHTFRVIERADVVVVHAPRAADREIAKLFGEHTGDDIDKFAECKWSDGPDGVPVLDGLDWFAGRIIDRSSGGDHMGYLLELVPDAGDSSRANEPQLSFQQVKDFHAGHDA